LRRGFALVIHGAGRASKDRLMPLLYILASRGFESLSIDLIGHGNSEGSISDSSIDGRTRLLEYFLITQKISHLSILVGFSMGCVNAIQLSLSEHYTVEQLVLFAPAAYHPSAHSILFGIQFSFVIRKLDSWRKSLTLRKIVDYRGKLLIFIGEKDNVIPKEIPMMYYTNARHTTSKIMVKIKSSGHKFSTLVSNQPSFAANITDIIMAQRALCDIDFKYSK